MSTWQGTARTLVRRLIAERTLVLAGATAILVVIGLIASIADGYDLMLLCILALQAVIIAYLLTSDERPGASDGGDVRGAVDRSSARVLADLAQARQSILDAIAQGGDAGHVGAVARAADEAQPTRVVPTVTPDDPQGS